jgi:tRNA(adenine34) deaminase
MMANDKFFMSEAFAEAKKSLDKGEIPVGAVLVSENKIISRGHNESIARIDPSAHAEILAMRVACFLRNNYRLPGCELYVTLEPCAMCLGAAVHARIKRLVFGAFDPKGGAVESIMNFPFEKTNHRIEIEGGVLAAECAQLLERFFKDKRQKN